MTSLWLWFVGCGETPVVAGPTDVEAEALADSAWGTAQACECRGRTVEVSGRRGVPVVVAVYDGLEDDSMRALRYTAEVHRDGAGAWVLGATTTDWRCWSERGHPWFSTGPCS